MNPNSNSMGSNDPGGSNDHLSNERVFEDMGESFEDEELVKLSVAVNAVKMGDFYVSPALARQIESDYQNEYYVINDNITKINRINGEPKVLPGSKNACKMINGGKSNKIPQTYELRALKRHKKLPSFNGPLPDQSGIMARPRVDFHQRVEPDRMAPNKSSASKIPLPTAQYTYARPPPIVTPDLSKQTKPSKRGATASAKKPCNCSKSQCLKLYCDCFGNGEYCTNCNCKDCHNKPEFEEERQQARKNCLERNPNAFKPKIGLSDATKGPNDAERSHHKGCNCKNSNCSKNYCECYEAKVRCTHLCKCTDCQNAYRYKELSLREKLGLSYYCMYTDNPHTTKEVGLFEGTDGVDGAAKLEKEIFAGPWEFICDNYMDHISLICYQDGLEKEKNGESEQEIEKHIMHGFSKMMNTFIQQAEEYNTEEIESRKAKKVEEASQVGGKGLVNTAMGSSQLIVEANDSCIPYMNYEKEKTLIEQNKIRLKKEVKDDKVSEVPE
uniref:CRC domain-containing protein n=1 Tax=Rhabditophanes sp. KR3021 TaxID=114890 RepID=A0AC35TJ17_9BILA